MAAASSEIRVTFLEEAQRWGDTIIATCQAEDGSTLKVKTTAEEGELVPGLAYLFYGYMTRHPKWGAQFAASSFVRVQPHDEAGMLAYLKRAPGIGPKTASALWTKYGPEAVRKLREDPVGTLLGIPIRKTYTPEQAAEIAAFLSQEAGTEDATIDLMSLLAGRGFPRTTLKKAIRKWGNRAAEIVRRDPYKLMAIPGAGFLRPDAMWIALGKNPAKLRRQVLCMAHAIQTDTEGHTWFDPADLERELAKAISSADVNPVKAARAGLRAGLFSIHRNGATHPWLTLAGRSSVEQDVADLVARMLSGAPRWPDLDGLDVSPHQLEQLRVALTGRIGIFGGSPGTGKTYTAARLIARISPGQVAVVAPTGKAACRISEALAGYGLTLKAKTIHSYLKPLPPDEGGDGLWSFQRNETNPVDEKFVVVDESSMVDVSLMASLLRALPPDAHLLLVGDVQQLPPVGHGAPLRDLRAAGVPTGELKEIRRNSGAIVETCARIRDEQPFDLPDHLDLDAKRNLALYPTEDGAASVDRILSIVRGIRAQQLADPVWDVQVIVAVNEKSPLARAPLNKLLQNELNGRNRPAGPDRKFWPGDKVVCLKNTFWPAVGEVLDQFEGDNQADEGMLRTGDDGRPQLYVANGELGRVLEEFPNKMILEFPNPKRVVLIPRGENGGEPFDLGYAISAHKSQGSEWKVVIVALDDYGGARMVCSREWIYTAISRAKTACLLVGQARTIHQMIRRVKIAERKTFLVERIREARKGKE